MKTVVIGLGIQGKKRSSIAGSDLVATVDPVEPSARFKTIQEVDLASYDAALVCTPDGAKREILEHLLGHKKHVLVEKPLFEESKGGLARLKQLAESNGAVCYTAYNHRFEPHIASMAKLVASGRLGKVYRVNMFYGNGTARDVRNSPWRDKGYGVLPDLGSHLFDTFEFVFGNLKAHIVSHSRFQCFENKSYDHGSFDLEGPLSVHCEMTLLSWRNHFVFDVYGEKGSAHISSLCKWGPTTFSVRERVLPSGKPPIESVTLECSDPTWAAEYRHFTSLCASSASNNISTDILIQGFLDQVAAKGGLEFKK